jgi:hypothetical protein
MERKFKFVPITNKKPQTNQQLLSVKRRRVKRSKKLLKDQKLLSKISQIPNRNLNSIDPKNQAIKTSAF